MLLDSGTSYKHDKAGKMFVKAIANVTKQSIVDKLKQQTQFLSITIDGSTDSTGEDLESIYVRTCQNGTADDLFLHIARVADLPPPFLTFCLQIYFQ
jgi:hypothetical protein